MKRLYIVLICVLLLIGCNNKEVSTGEVVNEEFITFIDALDREVTIKKNPEKVAALLGSFADVWILAGGEICATAEDAWDDFGLELDAVNIGGAHSPSLELLLSSNPEFVIASSSTSSNVEMKETLEDAGITVAILMLIIFMII